jgi:uncharacterized protein (DUF2235 family)
LAPKRIFVCSDGTWNVPDPTDGSKPTNVAKINRAILPVGWAGVQQLVFYDEGIGSQGFVDWLVPGHTGIGLWRKALNGYRFIAENWAPGDEVYLFGFSRGAYTVRCLAGFLGAAGLLEESDWMGAWRAFERGEWREPKRPLPIKLVGVWDTVDALGLPIPVLRQLTRPRLRFRDGELGPHVANGFQALAIDEIRSAFVPMLWTNDPAPGQRIEQVWFPGVHADCGGGYAEDGLADVALHWMIRRAEECGLSFDCDYERREIHANPGQALHQERKGLHRFKRIHERPVLEANSRTERIHCSAAARFDDAAAGYRPDNLRRAQALHGPGSCHGCERRRGGLGEHRNLRHD